MVDYLAEGAPASGFLSTKITESPRKNILEMKRSLLTGLLCKNQNVNSVMILSFR